MFKLKNIKSFDELRDLLKVASVEVKFSGRKVVVKKGDQILARVPLNEFAKQVKEISSIQGQKPINSRVVIEIGVEINRLNREGNENLNRSLLKRLGNLFARLRHAFKNLKSDIIVKGVDEGNVRLKAKMERFLGVVLEDEANTLKEPEDQVLIIPLDRNEADLFLKPGDLPDEPPIAEVEAPAQIVNLPGNKLKLAVQKKKVDPQRVLIARREDSESPYFLHRKGFPNQSATNCSFNSLSVIAAHVGFVIPKVHPENQPLYQEMGDPANFEKAIIHEIEVVKQQQTKLAQDRLNSQEKIENFSNQKAEIQKDLQKLKAELEDLGKELTDLEAQMPKVNARVAANKEIMKEIQDPRPALSKELSELKEQFKSSQDAALRIQIQKLEVEIAGFDGLFRNIVHDVTFPKTNLEDAIRFKKEEIRDKKLHLEIEVKKGQLSDIDEKIRSITSEHESSEYYLESRLKWLHDGLKMQKNLEKCEQILQILRGEQTGDLTMEDARLLSIVAGETLKGSVIYKGPEDVRADVDRAELKKALYSPDLRGIRVGGHRHWWTYIPNPDGLTVDEINDSSVYPKRYTLDQLFQKYSVPEEWSQTQITFYNGIVSAIF